MQISLQNFTTLVSNMAASAQGACSTLIDVTVGSVLRALLESSASVALWLQYLILQVLSMTRLATSTGSDVDSWVGDFGLTRLPALPATGIVVMTSLSPTSQGATIPNGALVKTADGSQGFTVTGGPYSRPPGQASVSVPVTAASFGPVGNVQAGTVTILGTAIPGVDTVSNPVPFTGGTAAETDSALRARFVTYLNTRVRATEQAVANAILSVQQGLTYVIQENVTYAGLALPGNFSVVVDDGSGAPPQSLLTSVYAAIDAVRPIGSTFSVNGPVLIQAVVVLTVATNGSNSFASTQQSVETAVADYIDGLAVGQALPFSRLAGLAYAADSSISNVLNVQLNGATDDIGGGSTTVVRAQSVVVEAA